MDILDDMGVCKLSTKVLKKNVNYSFNLSRWWPIDLYFGNLIERRAGKLINHLIKVGRIKAKYKV